MKARLTDMTGMKPVTVTFVTDETETAHELWDELNGADVELTVKKYSPKRSLRANAYMWLLITMLAAKLGMKKNEAYRELIKDIPLIVTEMSVADEALDALTKGWESNGLGWIVEYCGQNRFREGYSDVLLISGSSTFTSSQMASFIDAIINECKAQGISCDTEALRSLLEDDNEKHND